MGQTLERKTDFKYFVILRWNVNVNCRRGRTFPFSFRCPFYVVAPSPPNRPKAQFLSLHLQNLWHKSFSAKIKWLHHHWYIAPICICKQNTTWALFCSGRNDTFPVWLGNGLVLTRFFVFYSLLNNSVIESGSFHGVKVHSRAERKRTRQQCRFQMRS